MNRDSDGPELVPGVREVDHTADVGIDIEAPSLEDLFRRAALGMMALVRDEPVGRTGTGERTLALELDRSDLEGLMVRWLRELLHLQDAEGFVMGGVTFRRLDASGLEAILANAVGTAPPVLELKGVTYHGLRVTEDDGRWRARVIFDL